jgi:hypothetical protein
VPLRLWWVVVYLGVVACAAEPPRPATSEVPQPTQVVAAGVALDAPVLGGTRDAWLRAMGTPAQGASGRAVFDGNVAVLFVEAPAGVQRATRVELLLGHEQGFDRAGVPVAEARKMAEPLHPPDAEALRTEQAQNGEVLEVFQSRELGRALAVSGPATYVQVAERRAPTTNQVVLVVGERAE